MKKAILILVLGFGLNAVAQTAPTNGKKTLTVNEKYENEYSLEVFKSMYEAPYNYHMKKLPAKLAKYGFTNVTITALGSVQPVANKKGDVGLAIAKLQNGATISGAYSTAVNEVDMSQFQVNFTSDQGTFKDRLSSTATKLKYIIKE